MGSRWTWRLLALPGVAWLTIFFLLAFYAVVAVAFGNQNTLSEPVPFWNPLDWNVGYMLDDPQNIWHGEPVPHGLRAHVRVRRDRARALAPDRLPGRLLRRTPRRPLEAGSCSLLLILPFWINYLMRMLAWINLLSPDGLGTQVPEHDRDRAPLHLRRPARREGRLARGPAVHGDHGAHLRLPAVPDPAALRRRSTGSTSARSRPRATSAPARSSAFRRVTLPLSRPGILAGLVLIALPMFGDYYTPDLVSSSTKTNMIGNQIDQLTRQGS